MSVVKIPFFFLLLLAVADINAQTASPGPEKPIIIIHDNLTHVTLNLRGRSASGPLQYSFRTRSRYMACGWSRRRGKWSVWSSWSENRMYILSTREPYTALEVEVKARNSNNPEVDGPPGMTIVNIPPAKPVARITDISCSYRNVTPSCTISVETDCRKYNGRGFKVYYDFTLANASRNSRVYTSNLEDDGKVRFPFPPDLQPFSKYTITAYPANDIGRNDDPNLSQSKLISRRSSSGDVCYPVRCDGVVDCSDGSDEAVCPVLPGFVRRPKADALSIDSSGDACGSDQVRCGDGQCVPVTSLCDGQPDCRNGFDELDCPSTPPRAHPSPPMGPTIPPINSECGPLVTTSEGTRPGEFQVDNSDPYFLWYWTTVPDTFINLTLVRSDNNNNNNNNGNNKGTRPNIERLAPFVVHNPMELRRIKFSLTEKVEILGRDLPSQYNTEGTIQKVEVTSNYPVSWINCKTDDLLPLPQPTNSTVQALVVTVLVMMVVVLLVQCLVIGLFCRHAKFTQTPEFQRMLAWDGKTQTPERTQTPTDMEDVYSYATATQQFGSGNVSNHTYYNQDPNDPDNLYSNHELTNHRLRPTTTNSGTATTNSRTETARNHELTNRNSAEDHTYEELNLYIGNLRK